MKLRKSKVSMAVAATLGLACLAPSASFGNQEEKYSVNTAFNTQAGTLNASSGGDVLLFPFYTVANGAITNFSITNTSSSQVVAAKIRFREQVHSVDVLDFYVIFSPNDKFDFWVADDGPNGRPMMHWSDNSCIVGPPSGATSVEFPEAWRPFVETDAQMRVGHMELLGVVDLSKTALAQYAMHKNGVPRNCGALASVFKSPSKVSILNDDCRFETGTLTDGDVLRIPVANSCRSAGAATEGGVDLSGYGFLTDVGNVLMGRYIITIPGQGMEAGGDAIAIRDTQIANPANTGTGRLVRWHVTAQSDAACNMRNPSNCRTTNLYAWDQQEWAHPHLGELFNLAAFQKGLSASAVAGDWSNNPGNHVNVDWVLSFPSKYAYMDFVTLDSIVVLDASGQTVVAPVNGWVMLNHPKAQDFGNTVFPNSDGVWTRQRIVGDTNVLSATFNVFGFEENSTGGVSPGDPTMVLNNETNVFTLINTAIAEEATMPSVIQVSGNDRLSRAGVRFNLLDTTRGWARMNLNWPGGERVIDFDLDGRPGEVCTGLASNQIGVDLNNDTRCDDLYNSVFNAGEPGVAADYPRLYLPNEPLDGVADAVNFLLSPDLITPKSDAVTGIIFTTRATSDPTQNDATLTELQKF